jgi:hypothetical protein
MQTNDLLATGGMLQEGGTKDPVSGNDVPAGALKEEVRDSVDAKLSVGEFVFPADVTRYIGLDKLMQIRDAAKEGLQEMNSKGQMGNAEEVAADDSGNEDKFSSHIDEIIANLDKGESKKFATGGSVNADYSGAPIKGFKMVQYEDEQTKTVKYIPFVNGKPLLPIPKGYTEKKETVTPPTTPPPVIEQPVSPVAGGSGSSSSGGGKSTDGGDGTSGTGGTGGTEKTGGVEGFGDIQGGTSRNVGRVAGLAAGFVNPIFGLLVSAASQYSIKINNEKLAAANAAAIDSSALTAAGFNSADVERAKEAAAKATLEGKSAKEIAVAAANAAGTNTKATGINTSKTTLDALVGITNGFGTANKDVMAMPPELAEKVPPRMWDEVVKAIESGLTPEQAVQKVAETSFDKTVDSYFTGTMTEKEADARLKAARDSLEAEALGVPAGEYDSVIGDIQFGYTPKEAILRAEERAFGPTESELSAKDDQTRQEAKEKADKEQADRNAAVAKQEADREAADRAETVAAKEQADKAARDAADRAAEKMAQERADSEAAAREAQADRESRSGNRDVGPAPGTGNFGDAKGDLRGGGFND